MDSRTARFLAEHDARPWGDDTERVAAEHGFDPETGEFWDTDTAPDDSAPDPWSGYPDEHRVIPPGMARTIAEIETLLGGRARAPVPAPAPAPVEERDERGNTRHARRFMARAYQAERDGDAAALQLVLSEALADELLDEDEKARISSLAQSLRARRGWPACVERRKTPKKRKRRAAR